MPATEESVSPDWRTCAWLRSGELRLSCANCSSSVLYSRKVTESVARRGMPSGLNRVYLWRTLSKTHCSEFLRWLPISGESDEPGNREFQRKVQTGGAWLSGSILTS